MSWQPSNDPIPGDRRSCSALDIVIVPRVRDLGGFNVRRALPSAQRQMSGPFIFWDQAGPAEFGIGEGLDVRPHPHIGLATVTYLLGGHPPPRQPWLRASHRARRRELDDGGEGHRPFGAQRGGMESGRPPDFRHPSWVALPKAAEEARPNSSITGPRRCRPSRPKASAFALSQARCSAKSRRCTHFPECSTPMLSLRRARKCRSPWGTRNAPSYRRRTIEIAGDVLETRPDARLPARR